MLDLINQEIVLRRRMGDAPRLEDYDSDFPELAGPLSRLFDVHDAISLPTEFHAPPALPAVRGETPTDGLDGRLPHIAGYKVERVLGSGGMGVVYLAFDVALKRNVALKTMGQAQYAGLEQVERFLAEARTVAHLRHPNIIAIHAIVEHEGRSCLALEFVDGDDLKKRLAGKPMAPHPAAELIQTLARAVHAAHNAGVIHRDLKPSNILLTSEGIPKVADFGLAKLLGGDSARTLSGQVVGTPSYMAPEQAEGRSKHVGPAADVYALGAILYEALTGRPPFLGDSQLETLRLVCKTEPVSPKQLRPDIPRDLETICLKCLEKEPHKRYDSADVLAEDLRRFLADRPIIARRVGPAGRLQRWSRRNPWAAAFLAALSFGVLGSSWQAIRATTAQRTATLAEAAAKKERDRAESEAEIARAINEFLNDDLLAQASSEDQATIDTTADPDIKVRTLLDRAAGRINVKFADKPLVEASIHRTIGKTYTKLGLVPAATRHLERALELYRKALGEENVATLETMSALGELYVGSNSPLVAESVLLQARAGWQRLRGSDRVNAASTTISLAKCYDAQGKPELAESSFVEGLTGLRAARGKDHIETLNAMNELAMFYQHQGKLADAEPLLLEARDGLRRLKGPKHPDTLLVTNNLGQLFYLEDKLADAERLFVDVFKNRSEVLGPAHPATLDSKNDLAVLYGRQRRWLEAEKSMRDVLEGKRITLGPTHRQVFATVVSLASFCAQQNKFAEAEKSLTEALDACKRVYGSHDPDTLWIMTSLGGLYQLQSKLDEAEKLLVDVVAGLRMTLGAGHTDTLVAIGNLAALYGLQAKAAKAEPLLREVLKFRYERLGPDNTNTLFAMQAVASCYLNEGKLDEAQPLLEELRDRRNRVLIPDHPDTIATLDDLATCYRLQGKLDQAEALFLEVLKQRQRVFGKDHVNNTGTMDLLGLVRIARKKYIDAEKVLRECLAIRTKTTPNGWSKFISESILGASLAGQQKYGEAERHLLSAFNGMQGHEKTMIPAVKIRLSEAAKRLIKFYTALGKEEQRAEWLTRYGDLVFPGQPFAPP